MPKLTLIVNSHQLSDYQRCERLHQYTQIDQRGTDHMRDALVRGSGLHNLLYLYYQSRIKRQSIERAVMNAMRYMRFQRKMNSQHIATILPKALQYFAYYKDETWIPLQAEIGFTKLLYEDDDHLFVYEGKIDLIMEVQRIRAFVDHKSQMMRKNLPEESNQFLGYAWATELRLGIINYINLSPSIAPKDAFRRVICNYTPNLIEEWKQGAIETCLNMARDVKNNHFPKRRNGCLGVYGLCDFIDVCKQTNTNIIQGKLEKEFIKKERWSSWD